MWPFFGRDSSNQFPYELKDKYKNIKDPDSCLTIFKGVSKATKENVTIFHYDKKSGNNEQYEYTKACIKRLKTLRHPNIVTYLDSREDDASLCFATEYVEPLLDFIEKIEDLPQKNLYLSWGIFNILKAVSFLNRDATLRHNNIFSGTVFVNSAGEWKLGELGYVSESCSIFPFKIIQELHKYNPPEVKTNKSPDDSVFWSIDSWGLGIFIWEVFNGKMIDKNALKNTTKIPELLRPIYCNLVAASPQKRLSASKILESSQKGGSFFENDVVDTMLFLDEIHLKSKEEIKDLFTNIMPVLEIIPSSTATYKILPQMARAYEYGCESACLVQPLTEISKSLPNPQYEQTVVPFLIKLFNSTDRATRSLLLQNIEQIAEMVPKRVINEKIFPLLKNGFMDTNPRIREETVKAMVHLAPKLDNTNLNEEVLKHFARLQAKDDQGGIRTNTTVCLGKIAYCLCPQNRKLILLSAFLRALSDPFPPVRNSGVLAFAVSQQYFNLEDIAKKILPALCHLTVDPDKHVRESSFRTIKGFVSKLETVSEDPSLQKELESEVMSSHKPVASWAEWALTSVASKFSSKSTDMKSGSEDGNQPNGKVEKPIPKKLIETGDKHEIQSQKTNNTPWNENNIESSKRKNNLFEVPETIACLDTEDNMWNEESWVPLEDPMPEEKPKPEPKRDRKLRHTERNQENRKRQGPMKLGMKSGDDIKFE